MTNAGVFLPKPEFGFGHRKWANFGEAELTRNLEAGDSSLQIAPRYLRFFPELLEAEDFFSLTIYDRNILDADLPPEIVHVTSYTESGELAVLRAQEGTTARTWQAGSRVRNTIGAEFLSEMVSQFEKLEEVWDHFDAWSQYMMRMICALFKEAEFVNAFLTHRFGDLQGGPAALLGAGSDQPGNGLDTPAPGGVTDIDLADGAVTSAKLAEDVLARIFNVGEFKHSHKSGDHPYWMLCDGRVLREDKYPELLAVYNEEGWDFRQPGDPSETFRLIDGRGMTIVNAVETPGTNNWGVPHTAWPHAARAFGTETHTLTLSELPSWTMPGTVTANAQSSFSVATADIGLGSTILDFVTTIFGPTAFGYYGSIPVGVPPVTYVFGVAPAPNPFLSVTDIKVVLNDYFQIRVPSGGGGQEHNNVQPSLALNLFQYIGRVS